MLGAWLALPFILYPIPVEVSSATEAASPQGRCGLCHRLEDQDEAGLKKVYVAM